MAFSRVQGASTAWTGAGASTTIAVTLSAVGSGNAVCGIVTWDGAADVAISTIQDDQGNSYNVETRIKNDADVQYAAGFSRTNITNAPTVITVTFASSVAYRAILAEEFSGGSTSSSDERDVHGGQYQASPGTGTDGCTSGTFTTTVNGDLLYGVILSRAVDSQPAAGTSFTLGMRNNGDANLTSEYRTQTTAGSGTAATFTEAVTSGGACTWMIAIKPSGGGGSSAKENTGLHHIECGSPMGKKTNGILHPIRHGIVGWRRGLILPDRSIKRVTHTRRAA